METNAETWVAVEPSPETAQSEVELALTWSAPAAPVAPSWQGTVEKNYALPGTALRSGKPVARISGLDRIGFAGSVPFTRALALGSQGADVAELHRLLKVRGFDIPEGDRFTAATADAVELFAVSLGAMPGERQFRPEWVVYFADDSLTVDASELVVSAPAPGPGVKIFTPRTVLRGAAVHVQGSISGQLQAAPEPQQSGDTNAQLPSSRKAAAGSAMKVPADGRLLLGRDPIDLAKDRIHVADSALPRLEALLEAGATFAPGFVERQLSQNAVVVPASAVKSASSGKYCVLLKHGDQRKPVSVEIVSDVKGRVGVTGDLKAGDLVLVSAKPGGRVCE